MRRELELYGKMAEFGLSLDQALELSNQVLAEHSVSKQATIFTGAMDLVKGVTSIGDRLWPLIYAAGIGLPALGYLGGRQVAEIMDADRQDIKELQEEELIRELEQNTQMLQNRSRLKQRDLMKNQ